MLRIDAFRLIDKLRAAGIHCIGVESLPGIPYSSIVRLADGQVITSYTQGLPLVEQRRATA